MGETCHIPETPKICTVINNYGIRNQKTHPIHFPLMVDDFGVKYVGDKHLNHLITVLQQHYTLSVERSGNQ